MPNPAAGKKHKGAALFLVLGTLIVVVILAKVMLSAMLNQTQISRHHVSRIQAYYAAQAGMNYALERLRTKAWYYTSPTDSSCKEDTNDCVISDTNFPSSIGAFSGTADNREFRVIFCPKDHKCAPSTTTCNPPLGYAFCVNVSVIYESPSVPT